MEGWIKLHRQVMEHWIYCNPNYFRAWVIMLFTVNYEPKKSLINGLLIDCDRGQSLLSLESWVDLFGVSKKSGAWTIQKVRTFFDLLEQDKMITRENMIKTTRITICNYGIYQDNQQPSNNQVTTKQQPSNNQVTTTKESKEDKEVKKYIYSKFYDEQIEASNNDANYLQFVKILFGENNLKIPLTGILKLKNQLTYEQFALVYSEKMKYNISLTTILENIENRPDLLKTYSLLQRVLINWIRPKDFKK